MPDRIAALYRRIALTLSRTGDEALPLLARLIFAASLAGYFWASARTKLGGGAAGFLNPSTGAYAQIFPRQFEAVGYDASALSGWHWLVVVAGTWAEFLLPLLILLGLAARLAALGMAGFIAVQSLTDLYGHGGIAHAETLGAWFDRLPDGVILDQRAFWMLLLAIILFKGAGSLSLDALFRRRPGDRAAP